MAAACYRSATRAVDGRTGTTHDYRARRRDIAHREMIGWHADRAALWNAAETAEKRKDAVTARELQIALPRELPLRTNAMLAVALGMVLHRTHGVAVDVCVHRGTAKDGGGQPHAHLLFTTRRVTDGATFGAKTTEWDNRRTGSQCLEAIRAAWAGLCNAALAAAGRSERVDHRSYARQGTDTEATHIPRTAVALEAHGERTAAGDRAREATTRNRRRQPAPEGRAPGTTPPRMPAVPHWDTAPTHPRRR